MKNCGTCRFWEIKNDQRGVCGAIPGDQLDWDPKRPNKALAGVFDSYGSLGWLETAPEFGCVLHEEKPPA